MKLRPARLYHVLLVFIGLLVYWFIGLFSPPSVSAGVLFGQDAGGNFIVKGTVGAGTPTPTPFFQMTTGGIISNAQIPASNVSSGSFGTNTSGGNYSFPASVGIGTTGPGYGLDVYNAAGNVIRGGANGDFIFSLAGGTTAGTQLFSIRNNSTGVVHLNTQNSARLALGVSTGASAGTIVEQMTINSSGNVGIGTTGPSSPLHINFIEAVGTNKVLANFQATPGNSGASSILRVSASSYTSDFETNNGGTGSFRYGTYVDTNIVNNYTAAGGPFGNINFVTNGATKMTITGGNASGNVGIGTTGPGAKLDVQSGGTSINIRTNYLDFHGDNVGSSDRPYFRGTTTHMVIAPSTTGGTMYLAYPGDLTVGNTMTTRIQESLFISSTGSGGGGNVGIGTTGPTNKLDVVVSGTNYVGVGYPNSEPGLILAPGGGSPINANIRYGGGGLKLLAVASGTPTDTNGIFIQNGGNVGINATVPQYKLDLGSSVGQSATAGSGGLIRNATSADSSPYTQARIIVYGGTAVDTTNWGYLGYGADASMRIAYAKTSSGAPLLFGTTSAMDGTGTFTETMRLTTGGDVTVGGNLIVNGNLIKNSGGTSMIDLTGGGSAIQLLINASGAQSWLCKSAAGAGMRYIQACSGYDFAEYAPANDVEPGDIVYPSEKTLDFDANKIGNFQLEKTSRAYDQTLVGIMSTNGLSADPSSSVYEKKLALSGRVPTKVSTLNGVIKRNDPLTSSIIPGVGMKATRPGQVVAKALESTDSWSSQSCPAVSSLAAIMWPKDDGTNSSHPCFTLPDGTIVGKILAFIDVSWFDPDVYLTSTGDLKIVGDNSGSYTLQDKNNSTIDRIGAFAQVAAAKIRAGFIETQKLVVDGVDVAKKLQDLSAKVDSQQKEIDELKAAIENLKK